MYVAKTGASLYSNNTTKAPEEQNILGKDDFLRLLTTQLKYQDPMNPVQDQDFIAQLAQFTALEQTQNLTTVMEAFVESQERMAIIGQATGLLGREVTVVEPDSGELVTGKVSTIQFVDGAPRLVVNGQVYFLWEVQAIKA